MTIFHKASFERKLLERRGKKEQANLSFPMRQLRWHFVQVNHFVTWVFHRYSVLNCVTLRMMQDPNWMKESIVFRDMTVRKLTLTTLSRLS